MEIKNLGSNQTEVSWSNKTTVLVSYSTPVAAIVDGKVYRTEVKHSATTERHINKWLDGKTAVVMPQAFFDNVY